MKTAVLTWKLHNFGTALQAYALVNYINGKGVECKLLNYSLPGKDKIISFRKNTADVIIKKILNRADVYKKEKLNRQYEEKFSDKIKCQTNKFCDFYSDIPHDSHTVSKSDADYFNSVYDKIIVGSDQVWSPKYFCDTYFLDFAEDKKKYSYAPSLGVSYLSDEEKKYLKDKLEGHFQKISVRERTGRSLLETVLPDNEIICTIDPTLLLNSEQWSDLLDLELKNEEDYILVYTLAGNTWYKESIKEICSHLGIKKIFYITPSDNLYFYSDSSELISDAGPIDFLNYIKNAAYVITDSFHGVCFSVNFHKQFTCFERFDSNKGRPENSRVTDFLVDMKLKDRYWTSDSKGSLDLIDFNGIEQLLKYQRNGSKQYLDEILED